MLRKILLGVTFASAVMLQVQSVSAQGNSDGKCLSRCFEHYTQLLKKATSQQDRIKLLQLKTKCTEDCAPGGKGFNPENASQK